LELTKAAEEVQRFESGNLTARISGAEKTMEGLSAERLPATLVDLGIRESVLKAATVLKGALGQVNVLIHAVGILTSLPEILEPGEIISYLSLGAGNTGRPFDLETDRRVAEFKFISWRGGAESIRQNSLFKDLYLLQAADTSKRKQVFVTGDSYPLKFLHSARSLKSVMNRNRKLEDEFRRRYGDRFTTVREYYLELGREVEIVDLCRLFPGRFESPPGDNETVDHQT